MKKKRLQFDYSKLRGLLREKSITLADYASIINVSNTSLNERLANRIPFSQDEIKRTKRAFDLSASEIDFIFFTENTENRI